MKIVVIIDNKTKDFFYYIVDSDVEPVLVENKPYRYGRQEKDENKEPTKH